MVSKYQLTAREYEVWTMIARGMTQSAIAEEIHLSPATVYTHRKNLYRKLKLEAGNGTRKNVLATILYEWERSGA